MLSDSDLMPFGKHKGEPMCDVPAGYLMYLWDKNEEEYKDVGCIRRSRNMTEIMKYIEYNYEVLEYELKQNKI